MSKTKDRTIEDFMVEDGEFEDYFTCVMCVMVRGSEACLDALSDEGLSADEKGCGEVV